MAKVLVTGANGFVGRYIVKKLLEKNYEVNSFLHKNNDFISKLGTKEFYGDVANKEQLEKAIKNCDYVIHSAAVIGDPNYKKNYSVNVTGTKNLIELCEKYKIKRFIPISSISAIRDKKGSYGKTKEEMEVIMKSCKTHYTIIRPPLIYGKDSKGFNKIIKFIKAFPLIIFIVGSGNNKMQLVHIEDVAEATVKALENKKTDWKTYDIAGPDTLTFNEIIDVISSNLNIKKKKIHLPVALCYLLAIIMEKVTKTPLFTSEHIRSLSTTKLMDIKPAIKDLNYKPINIKEGISRLLKQKTE